MGPSHAHLRLVGLTCLLLALALPALAGSGSATIRSGHSGHWYDPARDGEGFALEILESDDALLYWFTYDEQGRQRWLVAVGHTERDESGEYLDFPALLVTRGGRFGPDFDPADVEREVVGSAMLRFDDCDSGEFAFAAFEQAMSFPVRRLSHTMGMPCESRHGVPGRESSELAGQSGSWFDLEHDGEGYSLLWIDPQRALLTWYSYDAEGEQYWMIGVGELDEQDRLHFPELVATQGARFGAAFDADDVERFAWGEVTLALGCADGGAQYNSQLAPFGQGEFQLQRLTQPRGLSCPYQKPTLTDLYEISYQPLQTPNANSQLFLTNDGSVYRRQLNEHPDSPVYEIARWTPDDSEWVVLPDTELRDYPWYFASKDGQRLARQRPVYDGQGTELRRDVEVRDGEQDWTMLIQHPELQLLPSVAAPNLSAFAGIEGDSTQFPASAWRWTTEQGLQLLPAPAETGSSAVRPSIVSRDDGRTIVGSALHDSPTLRWIDAGEPEVLRDLEGNALLYPGACNADCSLIFGSGMHTQGSPPTGTSQAWYWRGPGDMAYLGELEPGTGFAFDSSATLITDVTLDGSLATGSLEASTFGEALIWTERTGLVSLSPVLSELGVGFPQGLGATRRAARQVSDDGRWILIDIVVPNTWTTPATFQAGLLHLEPRSDGW